MQHHYGRHGPRAWLKWRKRHYVRPSVLPVPVARPSTTIFRIQIPIEAERIIIIVQGERRDDEQFVIENGQTVDGSSQNMRPPMLSSGDADLLFLAKSMARKDLKKLDELKPNSYGIILNKEKLQRRAEAVAETKVEEYCSSKRIYDFQELERLEGVFAATYMEYADGKLSADTEISDYITSKEEELVREFAIQDSKSIRPRLSDKRVAYHQRDKGVIRVLYVLGITNVEDALDHLDEVHPLADKYDDYFANQGREVIWPNEDSFRVP
jgi:hypothetical protein